MKKSKETTRNYKDMMKKTDPKSDYFKPFKLSLDKNETSKKFSVRLLPTYEDKFFKLGEEEMNLVVIAKRYWDTFDMKKRKISIFDKPVLSPNSFFLTGSSEDNDEIVGDTFSLLRTIREEGGSESDEKVVIGLLPKDVYYSVAMIDDEVVIWEYPKSVFDMIMELNGQLIDEADDDEDFYLINDIRNGRSLNVILERKAVGWEYRVTMSTKTNDAFPNKSDEEVEEILNNVEKVAEKSEIVDEEYLNKKFKKFLSIVENGFGSVEDDDNEDGDEQQEEEEMVVEPSSKKSGESVLDKLRKKQ